MYQFIGLSLPSELLSANRSKGKHSGMAEADFSGLCCIDWLFVFGDASPPIGNWSYWVVSSVAGQKGVLEQLVIKIIFSYAKQGCINAYSISFKITLLLRIVFLMTVSLFPWHERENKWQQEQNINSKTSVSVKLLFQTLVSVLVSA